MNTMLEETLTLQDGERVLTVSASVDMKSAPDVYRSAYRALFAATEAYERWKAHDQAEGSYNIGYALSGLLVPTFGVVQATMITLFFADDGARLASYLTEYFCGRFLDIFRAKYREIFKGEFDV